DVVKVHLEHQIPVVVAHLVQPHGGYECDLPTDDGHERVEPAELARGTGDEPVHVRPRPHIPDERDRARTRLCQRMDGITRSVRVDVGDGDSRTSPGERANDRASDAIASTPDYQAAHAVQGLSKVVHGPDPSTRAPPYRRCSYWSCGRSAPSFAVLVM